MGLGIVSSRIFLHLFLILFIADFSSGVKKGFIKTRKMSGKGGNGTWDYPWWFFSMARFNPGGPTFYGDENRLVPILYFKRSIMGVVAAGISFLLVLLIILPIIKHRLNSVIATLNSVLVGVAISLCILSPEWLRGSVAIQSRISYHSPMMYNLHMGVHIGLYTTNVTMKSIPNDSELANDLHQQPGYLSKDAEHFASGNFYYNEEIRMYDPEHFQGRMKESLARGLPIPLLTLMDFLTAATMGFEPPQRIMEAGYHTFLILVAAFVLWFIANIFIAAIPRYASYAFIGVGVLMIIANIVYFYWAMIDRHFPVITVSGKFIKLRYGICYWVCLSFGIWSCIYGFCTAVYDTVCPDMFLTIFDLDYDHKRALACAHLYNILPWGGMHDKHKLIHDESDRRKKMNTEDEKEEEEEEVYLEEDEIVQKRIPMVTFKLPTPSPEKDHYPYQSEIPEKENEGQEPQPGCSTTRPSYFQHIFGDTKL